MPDESATNAAHECVGTIIVRKEAVLLGKRSAGRVFYPNVWDVFGGHVEPGESHRQTLQRELREELGILPTAWQYLETVRGADATEQIECHFYVVTKWRGTPRNNQPREHSEIRWVRPEELARFELAHPGYVDLLRKAVDARLTQDGVCR